MSSEERHTLVSVMAVGSLALLVLLVSQSCESHTDEVQEVKSASPSVSVSVSVSTQVVTETETVTAYEIPDSCLTALQGIDTLSKPDDEISKYAGQIKDYLDSGVSAMAGSDQLALAVLAGKVGNANTGLAGAIVRKYDAKGIFDANYAECLEDLK